jgi:hypothetical protein
VAECLPIKLKAESWTQHHKKKKNNNNN